jgi:hypothetical protein
MMPKVQKKYGRVCRGFIQMFIISMILRQQLHIFHDASLHKSYNVGIVDMMIRRKDQLQVYVMAGMTRFLITKMMGATWSYSHRKLMMRMTRRIISQTLVMTIPRLDVVYSPSSFRSGGGAAATPHLNPPNKLYVVVRLDPTEKLKCERLFKMSLNKVLEESSRRHVECEVTFSEKLVEVFLTFEDPGSLGKVKKILETFEVDTIRNKKPFTRKLSVDIVKPKKSDKPLLPDFDMELLKMLKKRFGKVSVSDQHSSFLDDDFLIMSNLFLISEKVFLKTLVKDTRCAKVFRRHGLFGLRKFEFRVAHPDCPGLPEKCKNMCEGLTPSYEHGWEYVCDLDLPEVILRGPEFWECGFKAESANDKAEEIGFFRRL